jgi:undecaprenyl diphosphate synthase
MGLLREFLVSERGEMRQNAIRLHAIGDLGRLPEVVRQELAVAMAETRHHGGMILTLALSYGGREEIAQAARAAAAAGPVDEAALEAHLWTRGLPELDLLVRTSGERRISNFLLWQCAYAELCFVETLWPEFRERELLLALADFQARERRFGLTGGQQTGGGEGRR